MAGLSTGAGGMPLPESLGTQYIVLWPHDLFQI